ncbi:mas-related G-protein coupled receptor member X1-like [Gracilinanus agilis]|uniref:mas-related G-protein coupled receptor member X1-like n=1 Tax=Gracilinanus agilis TaxID=191870 RepID=UPI001CFD2FDA|nr:mas-related G-protein coupled receptor member X1-like [Gracilinanus agilis]
MAVSPTPELWKSDLDITVETSTNSSSDPVAEAHREIVSFDVIIILSLVIALVGLVGNSIVLWLLGFRIQRSPFSVYILNLAASDTLFLGSFFLFCMWDIVGDSYAVADLLWSCILYTPYWVGLSLLAVISTERCLSVLFPIWYRCHRPKHMSMAVCTALWALPVLYWGAFVTFKSLGNYHAYVFNRGLLFLRIGWFALLTCVMSVSSLTLALRVQCSSQRRQPPRLYLLILFTVLVFLLFGLPLWIFDSLGFFIDFSLIPPGLPWLLGCVNSSANPFIYFFLGSQWCRRGREPLRVVLQRALGEEQVEGVGSRDTSYTNTVDKLS